MNILEELCAGYVYLTQSQKSNYSQAPFALNLQTKKNKLNERIEQLNKDQPYRFWYNAYHRHLLRILSLKNSYQNDMRESLQILQEKNVHFQAMQTDIKLQLLKKYCFGFTQLLSDQEKIELANHAITQELIYCIKKEDGSQLTQVLHWYNFLLLQEHTYKFLFEQRFSEHTIKKIKSLFVNNEFLQALYRKNVNVLYDLDVLERNSLKEKFYARISGSHMRIDEAKNKFIDQSSKYLAPFVAVPLETFSELLALSFLDLSDFNQHHCLQISRRMLTQEKTANSSIINDYLSELIQHINLFLDKKQQNLDRNFNSLPIKAIHLLSTMKQSIFSSSLFASTHEKAQEVADSLFLFNAAGGESELGFLTNLWNVIRFKNMVKNGKHIGLSFFSLFKPLYDEFVSISNQECSPYLKITYYLVPIMVAISTTLGLFVAGCSVLPILASTIPSILVMIPLITIGLFAATCYTKGKATLHNKCAILKNKDYYNTPAFQINSRMLSAFGQEKAQAIKTLYVDELKNTESQMALFSKRKQQGTLNNKELLHWSNVKKKLLLLSQEWQTIHHDNNIGIDNLETIAKKRFSHVVRESSAQKLSALKQDVEMRVRKQSFFLFNHFCKSQIERTRTQNQQKKLLNHKTSDYESLLMQHQLLYA